MLFAFCHVAFSLAARVSRPQRSRRMFFDSSIQMLVGSRFALIAGKTPVLPVADLT
jgi:hypothetical protein